MKKRTMLVLIMVLSIGFASVSTNLIMQGFVGIGTNEYDVYFSGAILDGIDRTNELIIDKTNIIFEAGSLTKVGDKSELEYEITNNSTQYDAEVEIRCSLSGKSEVLEVNFDKRIFEIKSGAKGTGKIEIKLINPVINEETASITCELIANAKERTELGHNAEPERQYEIKGYFVNEKEEPVSNAYLAVYSERLTIKSQ